MPLHHKHKSTAPWLEVAVMPSDWDNAEPALLKTMLVQMVLIRTFEEYLLELAAASLIHGPVHSSIGQEGGAVGSALPLRSEDSVNGSHRGHHQFLAKVLSHLQPQGFDPLAEFSAEVRSAVLRTLAEIAGLDRGFSHGRGGSMHLQLKEAGAMGTNAIVGGGVPLAAGFAWAHKFAGTDAVSVTYFGDGAINIGSTLESFNLASAWKLPICFFIENNMYAVSTHVLESTGEPRLSARGRGFNIPSWKVDGMNPLAVHIAMSEAVAHMRAGNGPTMIEADVYRYFHQSGTFPGSAFGYRSKEEEASYKARDPILQVASHLIRRSLITQTEVDALIARGKKLMEESGNILLEPVPESNPPKRKIKDSEWPDPAFVNTGVRGDLSEYPDVDSEVIDLRWLHRASIDWQTIGASIKKTGHVLIAEQGAIGTSYGGWLADEIQRRYFSDLKGPIERVTGGEASPSISKVLERAAIAKKEEVVSKLQSLKTSGRFIIN